MSKNTETKTKAPLIVIRKASSVILTLLLVACLIFAAYSAIKSDGNGFYIGPYQCVTVLSGSMEPALSTGSLAVAKKVSENELSVGDIITFKPLEGRSVMVTHRITAISSDGSVFTTKGDSNNVEDSAPVLYESIVGKVVFGVPLVGFIINGLKTPPGIITLAALIILYEFIRYYLKKTKRGETDEKIN